MDRNDELAKILEERYGEEHPQDLHIDFFYLILGKELIEKSAEIEAALKTVGQWNSLESDWPGFIVGEFAKISTDKTERTREERLNTLVQKPLIEQLQNQFSSFKPPIIISRVCKYTRPIESEDSIETSAIEALTYPAAGDEDQHMDYFYLAMSFPMLPQGTIIWDMTTIFKLLPGAWKAVKPAGSWPLVFLGYFPKEPFESERQREWRLHKQVREPLKQHFQALISQDFPGQKIPILFTRVCRCTDM